MNSINSSDPRQFANSRPRTRRNRRNHTTVDALLPAQLLLSSRASEISSMPQTLGRPQQTGILWEPRRLYPPRPRRAPGTAVTHNQHIQQQSRLQPRNVSPLVEETIPDVKFSVKDAESLIEARKARMAEYLASWDETWAASSIDLSDAILGLDIGRMALDEPQTPALGTAPTQPISGATNGTSPPKSPEDSDGGVTIPKEEPEDSETRQHPTSSVQLAELKAKIPWLVKQRTMDGAGWRPLGEYYLGDGSKDVVP